MNNRRLLTGLLGACLSGSVLCGHAAESRVYTLDEIFETAETSSVQLRPTRSAEEAAERQLESARTARLPEITASLSVGYNGDGFTTKRNFSDYQKAPIPHLDNRVAVGISQPVYTGGAITGAIELAGERSTAERYATELARDNIRLQLTGFYLDLYRTANLRKVVEQNIAQAQKVLGDMEARYERGMALRNDITRYELLIATLQLQLTKLDNTLDILNHNLVETAGLPTGTRVIPDSTLLDRALPSSTEADWQSEATGHSPVLRLSDSEVTMSRTQEKLTRSELLPKVGVQAGWEFGGPILTEVPPINHNLSYWFVGVGVSYNLSSLYKTNRKLNADRARTYNAVDRLEASRQDVSLRVRSEYIRYREAHQELETNRKAVELAEINYNTVTTRYEEGMALITDQLDAANQKLLSEQELVNSRINIIYQYYKLLFISGKI